MASPSLVTNTWAFGFENTRSRTDSITGVSDSNRCLIAMYIGGNNSIQTCTYGGQSLSRVVLSQYPDVFTIDIWAIMNPPTGANNLYMYLNGNDYGVYYVLQFKDTKGWSSQTGASYKAGWSHQPVTITGLKKDDLVIGSALKNGYSITGCNISQILYNNAFGIRHMINQHAMTSDGDLTVDWTFSSSSDKSVGALMALEPLKFASSQVIWWD